MFILYIFSVASCERRVIIEKLPQALVQSWRHIPGVSRKKRVGVLISGSGMCHEIKNKTVLVGKDSK